MDSSAVTLLASKHSYQKLSTFTGAFKESKEFDETEFAKIAADSADAIQHIIYPNYTDFENNIENIIYMMDEPAAGPESSHNIWCQN